MLSICKQIDHLYSKLNKTGIHNCQLLSSPMIFLLKPILYFFYFCKQERRKFKKELVQTSPLFSYA